MASFDECLEPILKEMKPFGLVPWLQSNMVIMLKTLLIAPDNRMSREVMEALSRIPEVEVLNTLAAYPSTDELLRTIRVRKLDCVFLEVDDFSRAHDLIAFLDSSIPGFPVITLGSQKNFDLLPNLMRLGVREHLTTPIEFPALVEAVGSTQQHLKTHPVAAPRLSDLYTFLPAKPGVGTSTIALSVSCAIAEELDVRTLLMDCDLAAGAIQFLLKLGRSASLADALQHSENLDEGLWAQMVGRWGNLEVLHAGDLQPPPNIDLKDLQRVLRLARAQYDVICADLASSFDAFSIAMLQESRRIFLVTTPEVVALHMAAARRRRLTELELGDRVSLLLNRKTRSKFTDTEVARTVGVPVTHCFANDYAGVQDAILDASPISHKSDLGQRVLDLAHSLAPHVDPKPAAHSRKFLEFFHVSHVEDADAVWHG